MSLAVVFSRALAGLDAPFVRVEVHTGGGLPCTNIVGLPEKEVPYRWPNWRLITAIGKVSSKSP